jgi:uncharacterized membrane protein YkvA (DUF1232 family)
MRGLKEIACQVRQEISVYRLVLADRRTPLAAKLLLGAAVFYLLSPVDLIPDFIPVIGHLDDLIVVPLLVLAALALIPDDVVADCRRRVKSGQSSGH